MNVENQRKNIKIIWIGIIVSLGLFTLLGILKTLYLSMDIDEAYAIAQSYRLIKGDRLIAEMWEPHQLSAYFSAIFMYVYVLVFKSTTGIVLFLRSVGSVIHLLLGFMVFQTIYRERHKKAAYIAFFLHINFLTKWIAIPEFELMNYWFLLIGFLLARKAFRTQKNRYLLGLGIIIFLQMLNYPTLMLLYPVYLFGINRCMEKSLKKKIVLTLGAAISGVLFLIYLFSYMDMGAFFQGITHISADPSHTMIPIGKRLSGYGVEFLKDVFFMTVGFLAGYLLCFAFRTKGNRGVTALLIEITGYEVVHFLGCLLFDQNQFFLLHRFLLYLILGILLTVQKKDRKDRLLFVYFGFLPAIINVFAACLLSNMTLEVAFSKLFICVILVVCLLWDQGDTVYIPFLVTLAGLLLCKVLLIRVTGCLPVTVRAHMKPILDGPAKGIYLLEDQANIMNSNLADIKEHVQDGDRLFYFGCENLAYLYRDTEVCTASVQGTSVFNQDFLDYFELHPSKQPNVIVLDKSFEMLEVYHYSVWNDIVKNWINSREYSEMYDGEYVTIWRQEK